MFIKEEIERIIESVEFPSTRSRDVADDLKKLIEQLEEESSFIAVYKEKDDFGVYKTETDWAWSPGNNDDVMSFSAVLETARNKLVNDYISEVRYQEHIKNCKNLHHDEREQQVCDVKLFVAYQPVIVDDKIKEEAKRLYEISIDEKKRKELEEREQQEAQKKHWINKLRTEGYTITPPVVQK
jgi:hypothetical protein